MRTRFRPRKTPTRQSSTTSNRFNDQFSDYDDDYYDYDYDVDLQSSQKSVPTEITVTHAVPVRTVIPIRENGIDTFREILTTSPSLEVIAATQLKSTNIGGTPVIYANTQTNTPAPGTKVITFEALRATETTSIVFTPTRIRGLRTTFSDIVPSTIYNIKPVTTSVIEQVDNNELLTQLLLQLLAGKKGGDSALISALSPSPPQPQRPTPQLNPILPNLGINPSPAQTQFLTHTSTYVTTITNTESIVIPITFRGKLIKTTLVETNTEVVTATELSTQTIKPTAVVPLALATANPIGGLSPDFQQQLLAAQLQQQLQQQQQQALNQQLLSQLNLGGNFQTNIAGANEEANLQTEDNSSPQTSLVTIFVSGKNPGEFSKVVSTVTLTGDEDNRRFKRSNDEMLKLMLAPSKVQPVLRTVGPPSYAFNVSDEDNFSANLIL